MADINIGTSGFQYRHWKGAFYPEGLAQRRWFEYYTHVFNTVELNVTFYRLPNENTFHKWYQETPPGFVFSLKGSRFITHVKRLKSPREPLALFFDRAKGLKDKLGIVLWQLPPNFGKDLGRLDKFLKELGKYHIRNTFEFREKSWVDAEVISIISEHGHCLCMADWPQFNDEVPITSDFVYIRRHGHDGRYDSKYSNVELRRDARRIRQYLKGKKDVFIYFNNDAYGYAPQNAMELKEILAK